MYDLLASPGVRINFDTTSALYPVIDLAMRTLLDGACCSVGQMFWPAVLRSTAWHGGVYLLSAVLAASRAASAAEQQRQASKPETLALERFQSFLRVVFHDALAGHELDINQYYRVYVTDSADDEASNDAELPGASSERAASDRYAGGSRERHHGHHAKRCRPFAAV